MKYGAESIEKSKKIRRMIFIMHWRTSDATSDKTWSSHNSFYTRREDDN